MLCAVHYSKADNGFRSEDPWGESVQISTIGVDTIPVNERYGDFVTDPLFNPFDLSDPTVVEKKVEYDPESNRYVIYERVGSDYFRAPTYMTFQEYLEWKTKDQERRYFAQLAGLSGGAGGLNKREDPLDRVDVSSSLIDRLFGGSTVDVRPQGNIDVFFGLNHQFRDDPIAQEQFRNQLLFDFDMDIAMSLAGKIGEKLTLDANFNTNSTFDFEQRLKVAYDTDSWKFGEDQIIKKIEAGNVSLPLRGSLIPGTQNLFGLKTELQFGKLRTTLLAAQQRSEQQRLTLEGGAQLTEFEVFADDYDENRHFFLSHYNRENFEKSLERIPQINTLFQITKIEVWVTNDRRDIENDRDIVLLADFGEFGRFQPADGSPEIKTFVGAEADNRYRKGGVTNPDLAGNELPSNSANSLYREIVRDPISRNLSRVSSFLRSTFQLEQARDFEKVRARLLNSNEYTYHPQLGFISINTPLQPNQVIGVSYEYTYNGEVYQVGEFSEEAPEDIENPGVLFVKMLKSTTPRVDLPMWDLMMKNIYAIGAFNVDPNNFQVDFYYEQPSTDLGARRNLVGTELVNENLIEIFDLDNLNSQRDPQPDGRFDFVPGLTINTNTGRIMIPKLEPFGSFIRDYKNSAGNGLTADEQNTYVYQQLYDSTLFRAREFVELNRYVIRGSAKSDVTSQINLGAFGIPRGSVRVSAGGKQLVENVDYEINYGTGQLTILNDSYIQSGIPINVNFEDQSLFSFQQKTMLAARMDYEFNEHLNVGATYLNLFEQPFTQKVNVGQDPINNRVYGLDLNYNNEAPILTRLVDKLPLYSTKEKSTINFSAEMAVMQPGHAGAINNGPDDGGTVYIDDFEGAASSFDLRAAGLNGTWTLASVPSEFRESELTDDPRSNVNRAQFSWYRIDPFILGRDYATDEIRTDPYCEILQRRDLFPNVAQDQTNLFQNQNTFDLYFNPTRRGPYNYDVPSGTEFSTGAIAGEEGVELNDPTSRWGGVMRALPQTDFEAANIEFLDFWVLNPYINSTAASGGKLVIQLGNISEDVLKDGRFFYENGLPVDPADPTSIGLTSETNMGQVPVRPPIVNAFSNVQEELVNQDLGFDGFDNDKEREFFNDYVNAFTGQIGFPVVNSDPSGDDFVPIDDARFNTSSSCQERYRNFTNPEGNSRLSTNGTNTNRVGTRLPDAEDLDRNNSLDETESYYSYEINLDKDQNELKYDPALMTDTVRIPAFDGENGAPGIWYRFRVPLRTNLNNMRTIVGGIQDFRSIRFMRMYMTQFSEPVTLRFAELELNRSQWRRYTRFDDCNGADAASDFDIDVVSFVENAERQPFNYVLPPGIQREQSIGGVQNAFQNEQSLALQGCNLAEGCERGVFRLLDFDFRFYERLKMFVHAETPENSSLLQSDDPAVEVFIRMGSDLDNNYYEYSQDLVFSEYGLGLLDDPENIWPTANYVDFALDSLVILKQSGLDSMNTSNGTIKVVGLPNLAEMESIMIGMRAKRAFGSGDDDCVELWVNELRTTGLDEDGGVSAVARMDIQLADLANVAASWNLSTVGYGGIDQPILLRQREEISGYDVSTGIELGKFLPKESGVKIPLYAQYSRQTSTPQYDPYDQDVLLRDKVAVVGQERLEEARDFESITNINVTNVRKERSGNNNKTPMPWNIENFSASYSYTKEKQSDPIVEADVVKTHRGGIDYNYSTPRISITPFKKIIKSKKYFKWLQEFNFNPLPNSFSFSTVLDRRFGEIRYRSLDRSYYNKFFNWDRNYSVRWDLAKSLKLNYSATQRSIVDEPDEKVLNDRFGGDQALIKEFRRDSIWNNITDFGRPKSYNQNLDVTYTLPFKLLPFFNFINARVNVNTAYGWDAAALNIEYLGNVINNSQRRQFTADVDLTKLYRSVPYLKSIETPKKKSKSKGPSRINKRSSKKTTDDKAEEDINNKKGKGKKGDEKEKREGPSTFERILIRPLLAVRNVKLNYNRDYNSTVPGFVPSPELVGLGERLSAPGWKYTLGFQPDVAWLDNAAINEGWIVQSDELASQVIIGNRESWDARVTLEPIKNFQIDIDVKKQERDVTTINYKNVLRNGVDFQALNPRENGSYSISYFAARSLFGKNIRETFQEFSGNRRILSERLAEEAGLPDEEHPLDVGYRNGFGALQVDVVVPSFIAAYTGQDPGSVKLDARKQTPRPNWNVRFNGFTDIKFIGNIFQNFSLTHGYNSTFTINQINSNFDFVDDVSLRYSEKNTNIITQNYFAFYDIPAISIQEQFAPLLGLNMTTKSGMTIRFDHKRARNLELSLRESGELREQRTSEYSFSFGHVMKNVRIPFLMFGSKPKKTRGRAAREAKKNGVDPDAKLGGSDLNLSCEVSVRDDLTEVQLLDLEVDPQAARGARTVRVSPSIDYDINENLNMRFFVDYSSTTPYVSTGFPIRSTLGGINLRFTLK